MEAASNSAFESERSRQSLQQKAEQDEVLAATASIMLPEEITSHYFTQTEQDPQQIIYDTVESSDELCRVASEILSGVRRNVEVQIIHPNNIGFDTADYLNPIPKDEIMQESGLRSQQYDIGQDFFVTEEIDPVELGINMTTTGEEFFSDDFHYFGLGSNMVA